MWTEDLSRKLDRQVWLAAIHTVFFTTFLVMIIMSSTGLIDSDSFLTLTFVVLGTLFVFWVWGIVNAVTINTMTNGRFWILVIFAVFQFVFVHLIIACAFKKSVLPKYHDFHQTAEQHWALNETRNAHYTSFQKEEIIKLHDTFLAGTLSAKDYDAKLQKLSIKSPHLNDKT